MFYVPPWVEEIDKEFISRLAESARSDERCISRSDVEVIRSCLASVNNKFGTNLMYKDASMRFKYLQQRHTVFGFLISLQPVTYDAENNLVEADAYIWDYVTMKFPLLEAYMMKGEGQWSELCHIFGPPKSVNLFPKSDVIQISDDTVYKHVEPLVNNPTVIVAYHALLVAEPLDSSFWNHLYGASTHDKGSQEFVKLLNHNPFSTPHVNPFAGVYDQLWTEQDDRQPFGIFQPSPSGGGAGSYQSSSNTPKGHDKK